MSRPYQARSCATSTISATPAVDQRAHLGLDRVDRPRPLLAAERRDRTERARPVAALGHLHVGPRRGRRRAGQLEQVPDAGGLAAPEHHLGEATPSPANPTTASASGSASASSVAVALGHAAGDHEPGVGPLHLGQRERDVDRLLPGCLDERTGVDHDEVGVLGLVGGGEPVGEERGDHLVGVDGVLRAAQGLDEEPGGHARILPGRLSVDSRR